MCSFVSGISIKAGLPNITGSTGDTVGDHGGQFGVFTKSRGTQGFNGGRVSWYTLNFNASRSSSIYGSSTTVTPLSITTSFLMKY